MAEKVIIVAGNPEWYDAVQNQISTQGFAAAQFQETAGYVTKLTDAQAALILVDGEDSDWMFWVATAKSSPATRRIPIFVISPSAVRRSEAAQKGADLALAPADLLSDLPSLLPRWARVPDAAMVEQLACQCQETMPAEGLEAIRLFNAGEYYPQHDAFEALWMAEQGPVRDLYRAVLQVGIAYYQVTRGNYRGAQKMFLRSIQWLNLLPDICRGVDVAQLRADAAAVRAELDRVSQDSAAKFNQALLKGVGMVTAAGGDQAADVASQTE